MNRPDFRIYTASLVPDGNLADGKPSTVVRMTGSSTEQDVQKNRMTIDALRDMQQPTVVGMNIFLNHRYDLPYDLYGKLVEIPAISSQNGFLDLSLAVDTDTKNPAAMQTLQQIKDGHKHGCSIGCMVDAWEFAGEHENPMEDAIILTHVTPVEWSVVGIPANRRCWVENAISGKFVRTLDEGDYDQAYQLAPTVKSLFSYDYEKYVMRLSGVERTRFERVPARRTPSLQLFWQPDRSTFVMKRPGSAEKVLSRGEVMGLLQDAWGNASGSAPTTTLAPDQSGGDGGKAAQKSRSARYGIGIKDGGNVTKPGKWSSVPDSQWGDPVNYRYPMPDKAHADNAASRWGDASNRSQYNSKEQSIIGGRIKRRQAHFGSSSGSSDGKKDMGDKVTTSDADVYGPFERVDDYDNDIPVTQLDAQGLHAPYNGVHSHSHDHGPPDGSARKAPHSHPHKHNNDSHHIHDHTGNIDGDGGAPDGDNDQDEWNEPGAQRSAPQPMQAQAAVAGVDMTLTGIPPANTGGSQSVARMPVEPPQAMGTTSNMPAPTSSGHASSSTATPETGTGGSNAIPAPNNATSNTPPANNAGAYAAPPSPQLPPNVLASIGSHRETLLAHYNSVGQTLGLPPVDGSASETNGVAAFHMLAEEILTLSHRVEYTLLRLSEELHLSVPEIMQGILAALGKKTSTPREQGGQQPQNAPPPATTVVTAQTLPNTALSAETQARLDAVKRELAASEQKASDLAAQIERIQGRGLGRPTHAFPDRLVPYGFEPEIQAQSPEELRAKTAIVRRKDGVLCRKWASGLGLHQRPQLTPDQMSLMTPFDMNCYREGLEVLVPMIDEGD